ncbi:MAG TPA: hypothetical protein V6D06_19840 [Trichocoleus sp.]
MNRLPKIKWYRLLLALGLTFIAADTFPHPQLPPGLIASAIAKVTETSQTALDQMSPAERQARKADPGLAQVEF